MFFLPGIVSAQCPDSTLFDMNGDPFIPDTVVVFCEDELPDSCRMGVTAPVGDVLCFPLTSIGRSRNAFARPASSAEPATGDTGAVFLFGLGTDPTDDRVLIPATSHVLIEACRAEGLTVYDPDTSMIANGGGAVHYMCQALRRDTAA